ncbi:hypothetical protein AB4562_25255 [Vibrio sp. 10N.222.54.A1]|uniref:Uncharacterized protein n=2 Tax=Vibrio cyclitrophicus TaxID=47951 RepID=A0A7Z1S3I5_9VIBR|nr:MULTISPECIES: hypothetical protein [Vibrio]PMK83842.1 hypothetical protein BCT92_10705 [Vibrio sp. 10N.261.52.E5]PMP25091.1 hypothetical protein BCS91_12605 [Vibrio cyclitrophicus]PMP29958.1 hypothetical protein BCS90_00670 [Vibrio cyclitrophicus]TKF83812.1 hypothetical protein FCV65_09355 [Vibrio sp. F13]
MKPEVHRFELSINSTISEVYSHFTKANSDQILDRMFEGLQKKLRKINCSEREKECTFINVYIAYGKRQEDFDGKGKACEILSTRRIESIIKTHSNLSPENLLGEALRSLKQ